MAGLYGSPYGYGAPGVPGGAVGGYGMPQGYPGAQGAPQAVQGQQQPPGYACRPVTSREEAAAVQTEFFGPGTIMPDLGHGMIWLKRFNQSTGAADLLGFRLVQDDVPAVPAAPAPEYATKEDLEHLKEEVQAMVRQRGGGSNGTSK